MQGLSNHIISKFSWDTTFDQKERASQLQERLSSWSRMDMQTEILDIFDKVCPPEQTWRIDLLELNLGVVNYSDLEFELGLKLRQMLNEMLIDLIIHANKTGRSNIEILNEDASHISVLRSFLMNGIMPWNYKPAGGSVNQMMAYQLQNNRRQVIEMIREVGTIHENVRKRIAWQINDAGITKIIEGLEPNNHSQIIDFSAEMTKIQMKETVVQASTADFKKNLWLWILNYLLTERGTIFSKVAFMKSSIRQMAAYYNIAYDELFELIERAVDAISKVSAVKSDFLLTLKLLAKENRSSENKTHAEAEDLSFYRNRLKALFENRSLRISGELKAEFNELVAGLNKQDRKAFTELILSLGCSAELWAHVINDLNDASLEAVFAALSPANAQVITEHIYFLHRLGRKLNPALKRKTLWKIAMQFLQQQKNGVFSSSIFLNYCIDAISQKSKIMKQQLIGQLMNSRISSSVKTSAAMEMYSALNTVFMAGMAEQDSVFFTDNFKELLEASGRQIISGTIDKELFRSVRRSFMRNVELQPAQALALLMNYADKKMLRKLLPYLLNAHSVKLLLKHVRKENTDVLFAASDVLMNLKKENKTTLPAATTAELLLTTGLQVAVFYPAASPFRFFELILEELYENTAASEAIQFSVFTELLLRDEKLSAFGISGSAAVQLAKKYVLNEKRSFDERVELLIAASENEQYEIQKALKAGFSAKEYAQVLTLETKKREALLNCLLDDGKQLMQALLKEYAALLRAQTDQATEKETMQLLTILYWKCILNYRDHKGKKDALKRSFKFAVLYTFSIKEKKVFEEHVLNSVAQNEQIYILKNGEQLQSKTIFALIEKGFAKGASVVYYKGVKLEMKELIALAKKHSQKNKQNKNEAANSSYRLKNGAEVRGITLFYLIEQGLSTGSMSIQQNGTSFQLEELIVVALEKNPAALRKIIAEVIGKKQPQQISILKTSVSFDTFCSRIMNDSPGTMKEAAGSLRSIWSLFAAIAPGKIAEQLKDDCWQLSIKLIAVGTGSVSTEIQKLLQQATYLLAKERDVNAAFIISVMKEKNIKLTPAVKEMMYGLIPGMQALAANEPAKDPAAELQKAESKGMLEEICMYIISHKEIPAWFENAGSQKTGTLLNEIIAHYPLVFLDVIKQEIITEPQLDWLHKSVDMKELIRSAGTLNRNQQPLLTIFGELYHSMGRAAVKGVAATEIRFLLFRKLIKAWTSGNWRILSAANIWNELTWDLCVKKGVVKKELMSGFEKIKIHFPLSMQVSLEQLKDRERTALAVEKAVVTKPVLPVLKTAATKTAKGGIPVKNAGLVLISGYIEMLFDRLGIVSAKKFADENAATNAPHYLQYVVTGLSATEESLLPLNKVLCGLPLSEPLRESITITDEHKKLIEGLLKAMIGYWPAIGNCSTEGFRGNWLVREGLLLEYDDKWELTVEKRAYDVLIHQSPFSFSIIKLPWMSKPLHVTWPY